MNQFHIEHLRKEPVLSIKYQGQEKVCQEVLETYNKGQNDSIKVRENLYI